MTGIEALQALKEGKKVKRFDWDEDENLSLYCERIHPSFAFTKNRWNLINKTEPRDFDQILVNVFTDFLLDDWEIV